MAKTTAKAASAPKRAAEIKGRILYGENDSSVLAAQAPIFESAGYVVERAVGREGVQKAFRPGQFDAIVLGHTLSKDDRHHLPYMAKKAESEIRILVLHFSGKHHAVDRAVDTRMGFEDALDALAELVAERHMVPA